MINGKSVLALIPARGGSKGLPGKNIRSFRGKPLIAWPIEIGLASPFIDEVVVSTDATQIAEVAQLHGATVSMRPAELATDTAIVADLIRDLLQTLASQGKVFHYLVLLEATSPMRTQELVDECIEQMERTGADSIATFTESDPPPTRLWKIEDNIASTYIEGANPWLPRQQQEIAYHLNGLVYGFVIDTFISANSDTIFVGKGAAKITSIPCIDIDTLADFRIAEYLLSEEFNEHTI